MLAIDPAGMVATALSTATTLVAQPFSILGAAQSTVGAAEGAVNIGSTNIHGITDKLTTGATSAVTQASGLAQFIKTQLNNMRMMMINLGNQARIEIATAARSARHTMKERALKAVDDAKAKIKEMRTFRFWLKIIRKLFRVFKYLFVVVMIFKNIGLWAVRFIEVLIYRIFHLKDCFLWYFLELIGFVLYIPVEFVVWLLCLQGAEKSVWKTVDELDCMFADMTGYHITHYSDSVLQKCYAMQFPPFPMGVLPAEAAGEITEESMVRFLLTWFMPPSPNEIREVMHLVLVAMRESMPIVVETTGAFADEIGEMFKVHKGDEKQKISDSASSMVSV